MSEERKHEKTQKLFDKLEKLTSRLAGETLSPLQRLTVQAKLDRIYAKLDRRRSKIEFQELKDSYGVKKDARLDTFNKLLEGRYAELTPIDDQLDAANLELDTLLTSLNRRRQSNDAINEIGTDGRSKKALGGREFSPIHNSTELEKKIAAQKSAISKLEAQRKAKEDEIIQAKKDYIEQEIKNDADHKKELKEYKPSLWKNIRNGISKMAGNVRSFFTDVAEERKIRKEAREATREAIRKAREDGRSNRDANIALERTAKTEQQLTETNNRENEFKQSIKFEQDNIEYQSAPEEGHDEQGKPLGKGRDKYSEGEQK